MGIGIALQVEAGTNGGFESVSAGVRHGRHHERLWAAAATALRLDAVALWIRDSGAGPAALLQDCAAILAHDRRFLLCAAGLTLPLARPLRAAEDLATLDAMSGGRLSVALRVGAARRSDGPVSGPVLAAAQQHVAFLRRAWSGKPLTASDPGGSVQHLEVHPRPERPGGPELWVDAFGSDAMRLAGWAASQGLGLAAGADESLRCYLRAWRAAGRDPNDARIACWLPEPACETPAAARAELAALARRVGVSAGASILGILDDTALRESPYTARPGR